MKWKEQDTNVVWFTEYSTMMFCKINDDTAINFKTPKLVSIIDTDTKTSFHRYGPTLAIGLV